MTARPDRPAPMVTSMATPMAAPLTGACVAALLWCAPLAAQEEPDEIEPRFDAGEPFGPNGPELELELQLEFQRDVNRQPPDEGERDNAAYEADLAIGLVQPLGERLELLADVELRAREFTGEREGDGDATVRLERLYLQHENAADTRRWRLGRQKLDDSMGWFVDEELDGLRYTFERGITRLDVSFTRESWLEVGAEERDDIVYNGLAVYRIDASDDSRWLPYLLHRSERQFGGGDDAAETTWIGLQGLIRLNEGFRYWLNASARTGEAAGDVEDNAIGGVAVDLGVTRTFFDRRFRPGRHDRLRERERRRRRERRHRRHVPSERAALQRVRAERPEPLPLPRRGGRPGADQPRGHHAGAGVAVRRALVGRPRLAQLPPGRGERTDLRGTDLDFDPDGGTDDLGRALDLVVGYEASKRLEFLAVAGRFEPGDAFDARPDAAWLLRLEMEYDLGL